MSENKADPLRESVEALFEGGFIDAGWKHMGINPYDAQWALELEHRLKPIRAALAAPQPAGDQDLVNMLWTWFEERGHDLREELTYGMTSEEFRIMLDEHEANLLPDGHTPPQPAAPLGGRDAIARIIFDKACGLSRWDDDFYAEERQGCLETADAILAAIPQERGVERAAVIENLREAWSALAMIRETIETLGPIGAVKASEHLDGPTFMHEADALVAGIRALAGKETGR